MIFCFFIVVVGWLFVDLFKFALLRVLLDWLLLCLWLCCLGLLVIWFIGDGVLLVRVLLLF